MTLLELRAALVRQGVRLSLSNTGKLRYDAPAGLPAELLAGLREHRAALLAELARGSLETIAADPAPPTVAALPEPLTRLVRAAAGGHLATVATLQSGVVMDLGAYVLAWAATYLTGDSEQSRQRLDEAYQGWQAL